MQATVRQPISQPPFNSLNTAKQAVLSGWHSCLVSWAGRLAEWLLIHLPQCHIFTEALSSAVTGRQEFPPATQVRLYYPGSTAVKHSELAHKQGNSSCPLPSVVAQRKQQVRSLF